MENGMPEDDRGLEVLILIRNHKPYLNISHQH
jgi:hypothetical protein